MKSGLHTNTIFLTTSSQKGLCPFTIHSKMFYTLSSATMNAHINKMKMPAYRTRFKMKQKRSQHALSVVVILVLAMYGAFSAPLLTFRWLEVMSMPCM